MKEKPVHQQAGHVLDKVVVKVDRWIHWKTKKCKVIHRWRLAFAFKHFLSFFIYSVTTLTLLNTGYKLKLNGNVPVKGQGFHQTAEAIFIHRHSDCWSRNNCEEKDVLREAKPQKWGRYTYPNLYVIRALVILLVENLKVVSSGWDQTRGETRKEQLLLLDIEHYHIYIYRVNLSKICCPTGKKAKKWQ